MVGAILWSAADLHYPDYDGFTVYLRPPHCPAPMPPENPGAKNHSIVRARSASATPSGRGRGDALESSTSLPQPDGASPRTPDVFSESGAGSSDISRQLFANGDDSLSHSEEAPSRRRPADLSHPAAPGADASSGERGRTTRGGGSGPDSTRGQHVASEAVERSGRSRDGRPDGASGEPLPQDVTAALDDARCYRTEEFDEDECGSVTQDMSSVLRITADAGHANGGAAVHRERHGHGAQKNGEAAEQLGSPEERKLEETTCGVSGSVTQHGLADATGGGVGKRVGARVESNAQEVDTCGEVDEEERDERRGTGEVGQHSGAMDEMESVQRGSKARPGEADYAADVSTRGSVDGGDPSAVEAVGDRPWERTYGLGSTEVVDDEEEGWQSPFDKQSVGGEEGIFGSTTTDAELVASPEDLPVGRHSDSATVQRVTLFAEEMAALNRRAAKECVIM